MSIWKAHICVCGGFIPPSLPLSCCYQLWLHSLQQVGLEGSPSTSPEVQGLVDTG